jgi:hypothetical protein
VYSQQAGEALEKETVEERRRRRVWKLAKECMVGYARLYNEGRISMIYDRRDGSCFGV